MPRRKKVEEPNMIQPDGAVEAAPAPKRTSKARIVDEEIVLQCAGSEWSVNDVKEKAIAVYVSEGHRRGNIKKLSLYLKPEERRAYYVINEKTAGSINLE